jgi:rod shape-determining protein MreD
LISNFSKLEPRKLQTVNWAVTAGSVFLCLLVLPMRLPGMELLSVSPNWLLIWVVAWSVKRSGFEGALAGLVLGLIQDGMTYPDPTHALSLAIVGFLTARLQKQRYIKEDFISISLIVFGMAVLAATITAVQFSFYSPAAGSEMATRTLGEIWTNHQRIALSSAILSSLWAPAVYYPLNRWWEMVETVVQPQQNKLKKTPSF